MPCRPRMEAAEKEQLLIVLWDSWLERKRRKVVFFSLLTIGSLDIHIDSHFDATESILVVVVGGHCHTLSVLPSVHLQSNQHRTSLNQIFVLINKSQFLKNRHFQFLGSKFYFQITAAATDTKITNQLLVSSYVRSFFFAQLAASLSLSSFFLSLSVCVCVSVCLSFLSVRKLLWSALLVYLCLCLSLSLQRERSTRLTLPVSAYGRSAEK